MCVCVCVYVCTLFLFKGCPENCLSCAIDGEASGQCDRCKDGFVLSNNDRQTCLGNSYNLYLVLEMFSHIFPLEYLKECLFQLLYTIINILIITTLLMKCFVVVTSQKNVVL